MKITIVLGAFFPVPPIMGGAVEKVWFALAREFVRCGHEVVQISRAHPTLPRREMREGVQHIRIKGFAQPRSIIWLKFLDLIYSIRAFRILPSADVIVTNTFWLPVLLRSSRCGKLYVHVARYPKGQMRFYGHAARLQAVSSEIARAITSQAPRLREKVRVIPNAIPFHLGKSDSSNRHGTILFVGRVHPEKGLELLMHAIRRLPAHLLLNWRLKIVGPSDTKLGGGGEEFLTYLRDLGNQTGARIEFVGPVFDQAELTANYRSALLFVYPSIAETGEALPVAPLEAMAMGCAPIVSDLACFRDYIEDGVTGFVFDHRGDQPEQTFANRLQEILRLGDDAIARVGATAREKAAEFSVEPVAQRYLKDFESLLVAQQS